MPDIYTLFKEALTAAAAVWAVYVAHEGLKTWRHQLTGSNEYELSRRVLRALYQWRRALSTVRHPAIWVTEAAPLDNVEGRTPKERHFAGISAAYEKRWKGLSDARVALEAELLETEVLWGPVVREACQELWKLQAELLGYLESYLTTLNPNVTEDERQTYADMLRGDRKCLYESLTRDGGFTSEVNAVIAQVEALLKPYLQR